MVVHPWSAFSPEVNYTALASGSGPAPTLAYAETLSAQAAQVQAVVAASTANAAATYGTTWRGAGASASAVAQAALDTQHELLAAALLEKASHVAAAAGAHQSAVASMVTAQQAEANRRDEATAQQLNPLVWGALTPQIAALNLEYYGQMWPRNAAAGAAYGAALRAAATAIMVPFPPAVSGGKPTAVAAGLTETAALSAAGTTLQASEQATHAVIPPAMAAPQAAAAAIQRAAPSASAPDSPPTPPTIAALAGTQPPGHTTGVPRAPVGMFAPRSPAGPLAAPTAPTPGGDGLASSQLAEALQTRAGTLTPPTGSHPGSAGAVSGYPGAGATSYIRPSGDGFSPPAVKRPGIGAPAGMLTLLAAALVDKAAQVVAAAGAHQSAVASMVTAEEARVNRVDEAAAQQLNPLVWGALTPKIVALNVEYYGQMWPHNAAATAYGAALRAAAAAIMVPFPPAVPGASLAAAAVGLGEAGAISAAGPTLRASEQAAHAVLTPAAATPQSGAGALGDAVPLAGSAVPSAAPKAASVAGTPTAAQTVHPAPQAAVGMFARISPAGVVGAPTGAPPAGEGPASAQLAEALQSRAGALTPPGSEPGPGVVSGYPGAGFTSYVRPTGDGFAPPPVERAGSSAPAGMLNAAALGGPVTTPSLTAPMQPLAYVHFFFRCV